MIGHGGHDFNPEYFPEASHEVQHKLGSLVTDHLFWEPMQSPDALLKQLNDSKRGDVGPCEGDTEMRPLVYRDTLTQGQVEQMSHTDTVVILSSIKVL